MKISKKSIWAMVYRFTYNSHLPNNLCPFFWKALFGFIIWIPNAILQLPGLIFDRRSDCFDRRVKGLVSYFFMLVGAFYAISIYNWILAISGAYSYNKDLANAGISFTIAFVIIFAGWWINKLYSRAKVKSSERYQRMSIDERIKYWEEKERPNVIVEFIKATYHKYCPKLDWE
jgi:hypothetical protein